MGEHLSEITALLIEGNFNEIADITYSALEGGISADKILDLGLMPGMDHIGIEFKAGRVFVPEVLRSAKAMQESMDIIRPILAETGSEPTGKIVLGTVKGDLHDIGKNLVGMMCEGAGFEVIDLGKNVDPQEFVDAMNELQPDILGISAMLTTTMMSMDRTIQALQNAGIREQVIVLVGGAPVNQDFADQIGADGYASNAASAADLAKKMVNQNRS
jgi:5-methyltetrahydrofolate--homocysteine methyltransferase